MSFRSHVIILGTPSKRCKSFFSLISSISSGLSTLSSPSSYNKRICGISNSSYRRSRLGRQFFLNNTLRSLLDLPLKWPSLKKSFSTSSCPTVFSNRSSFSSASSLTLSSLLGKTFSMLLGICIFQLVIWSVCSLCFMPISCIVVRSESTSYITLNFDVCLLLLLIQQILGKQLRLT